MHRLEREARMDGGVCTMCADGEWPSEALTCPVCDAEIADDEDPHEACSACGEEHPIGVMDEGLCPSCGDEDEEA